MRSSFLISSFIHVLVIALLFFSAGILPVRDIENITSFPVELIVSQEELQSKKSEAKEEVEAPRPTPAKREETKKQIRKENNKEQETKSAPPKKDSAPVQEKINPPLPSEPEKLVEDSLPKEFIKPNSKPKQDKQESKQQEVRLPEDIPLSQIQPKPSSLASSLEQKEKSSSSFETKKKEENSLENEIEALLKKGKSSDKEKSAGKKQTDEVRIGGTKLSADEMDELRRQIQLCWNVPAGIADPSSLIVSVRFRLNRLGEVEGSPEIISGLGNLGIQRAAAESARRAILKCAPYRLPPEKYDTWSEVTVNFDPRDMF